MSGLDLYLAQRTLALLFVYASAAGFGLGAIYDGLRVLRMLVGVFPSREPPAANPSEKPSAGQGRRPILSSILLFFEDIGFMLMASITLILLGYYAGDGQLRAPAVVGLLAGFFVYRHTVSPWLVPLADRLIRWIKHLLAAWLAGLFRLACVPLRLLWAVTVRRILSARRERRTERRIRELTESASRGFGLAEEIEKHPDSPA
jgi:hypothetical protein